MLDSESPGNHAKTSSSNLEATHSSWEQPYFVHFLRKKWNLNIYNLNKNILQCKLHSPIFLLLCDTIETVP